MRAIEVYGVLERPRSLLEAAAEVNAELEERRQKYLPGSPILSDMPKSRTNGARDLSDWAAEAEPLLSARKRIAYTYAEAYGEAARLIDQVKSRKGRQALMAYYLRGISVKQISYREGVSYHCIYMRIQRAISSISDD